MKQFISLLAIATFLISTISNNVCESQDKRLEFELIRTFPESEYSFPGGLSSLQFTPDGKHLLGATAHPATLSLMEVETGKIIKQIVVDGELEIGSLDFSANEQEVLIGLHGGFKGTGRVDIWNLQTGECVSRLPIDEPASISDAYQVSFFDNEEHVVALLQRKILIWDRRSGERLAVHELKPGAARLLRACLIDPMHRRVIYPGSRNEITVLSWPGMESVTSKPDEQIIELDDALNTVCLSPDGKTSISLIQSRDVFEFDGADLQLRGEVEGEELILFSSPIDENTKILTQHWKGKLIVIDQASGETLHQFPNATTPEPLRQFASEFRNRLSFPQTAIELPFIRQQGRS